MFILIITLSVGTRHITAVTALREIVALLFCAYKKKKIPINILYLAGYLGARLIQIIKFKKLVFHSFIINIYLQYYNTVMYTDISYTYVHLHMIQCVQYLYQYIYTLSQYVTIVFRANKAFVVTHTRRYRIQVVCYSVGFLPHRRRIASSERYQHWVGRE